MRKIAVLPLVAVAFACGDTVTALDDPGVAINAKAQGKGPKAEYSFVYDTEPDGGLGGGCWKKSPEIQFGKTFWCATEGPAADPTFVLRVLKDGESVEGGEVRFARCQSVKAGTAYGVGTIMDWTYCGVLLKKYGRYFGGVDYKTVQVSRDGTARLLLGDFWDAPAKEDAVWGMHWEYDQGDGGKSEADIKWRDLAYVGYANPPDAE